MSRFLFQLQREKHKKLKYKRLCVDFFFLKRRKKRKKMKSNDYNSIMYIILIPSIFPLLLLSCRVDIFEEKKKKRD